MKISKYLNDVFIVAVIVCTLSSAYFVSQRIDKPLLFINKQQTTLNLDQKIWKYFNLGQKRLISSILWIATIIESDVDHYKGKDLNSWMFLRFNSISYLEPKFYENYAFGGPYLSVIKDDLEGATVIFNKGLIEYPNDYNLLNKASFHFYFELKDTDAAYDILRRLNQFDKTSPIAKTTLSRIEASKGNLDGAYQILSDFQKNFKAEDFIWKKIQEFRYSIRAELDLNCLNTQLKACSDVDLNGIPYVQKNGKFEAVEKWTPYRPKWLKK